MREEHRLNVSGNIVLKKIFEPKRKKLTGNGIKFYYEEFHDLYSPQNIIRCKQIKNEMGRACGTQWRNRRMCVEVFDRKTL